MAKSSPYGALGIADTLLNNLTQYRADEYSSLWELMPKSDRSTIVDQVIAGFPQKALESFMGFARNGDIPATEFQEHPRLLEITLALFQLDKELHDYQDGQVALQVQFNVTKQALIDYINKDHSEGSLWDHMQKSVNDGSAYGADVMLLEVGVMETGQLVKSFVQKAMKTHSVDWKGLAEIGQKCGELWQTYGKMNQDQAAMQTEFQDLQDKVLDIAGMKPSASQGEPKTPEHHAHVISRDFSQKIMGLLTKAREATKKAEDLEIVGTVYV